MSERVEISNQVFHALSMRMDKDSFTVGDIVQWAAGKSVREIKGGAYGWGSRMGDASVNQVLAVIAQFQDRPDLPVKAVNRLRSGKPVIDADLDQVILPAETMQALQEEAAKYLRDRIKGTKRRLLNAERRGLPRLVS